MPELTPLPNAPAAIAEAPEPRRIFDIIGAVAYLRSIGADSATVTWLRAHIATGEIPHVKVGKKFYCSRSALDQWLERHERRGNR
jgi:excisionase family DNA binding protein